MRISSDTVIALLLLVISSVLFYDTFHFRVTPLSIVPPSWWPRVVLVLMFIFSLVYLVQSLRNTPAAANPDAAPFQLRDWIGANRNVLWCFGLFALFLLTLPVLGMLIGCTLFVFAALTAMGPNNMRSHAVNALIAAASMGIMWAIFTYALGVMLPQGQILRIF